MFVDSHCHLTYEPISNDVEKIIKGFKLNTKISYGTNYDFK